MTPRPKVTVIVNPAANKGGARRRWAAIAAQLTARLGPFTPQFTIAPGHATALARLALAEGARRFVAVGGDGTVNEVLNGLIDPSGCLVEPDAVRARFPPARPTSSAARSAICSRPRAPTMRWRALRPARSTCCGSAAWNSTAGRSRASAI